ncbi:MAG: fibronectin type III domain-containing protein, partial [Verrucomicrobiales bacterium]
MNKFILSGFLSLFGVVFFGLNISAETDPRFYAVEVSANVSTSPAQIVLSWPKDDRATGYSVSRKNFSDSSWNNVANIGGSSTSYTDNNVSVGNAYEYRILKGTSIGYSGSGYIYAGINAPLKDTRGKVILLVDNLYAGDLSAELKRLEYDLAGDGWTVVRRDVSRNDSVGNIKSIIKGIYNADPSNTKAVFLFGHIPVPYSGNFTPDGHPDHQGAWPADLYYG